MTLPEGVEIVGETRDTTLSQNEDSAGRVDVREQYLRLSQVDAGGGKYLVIETDRWAIDADEIDGFANMLKEFMRAK